MKLTTLAAVLLIPLSGCAPEISAGNAVGGTISHSDTLGQSREGLLKIADAECAKYGKVAKLHETDHMEGSTTYDCVKPD